MPREIIRETLGKGIYKITLIRVNDNLYKDGDGPFAFRWFHPFAPWIAMAWTLCLTLIMFQAVNYCQIICFIYIFSRIQSRLIGINVSIEKLVPYNNAE